MTWRIWPMIAITALAQAACSSENNSTSTGGSTSTSTLLDGGGGPTCTTALEQALDPIDSVSTGDVTILSTANGVTTLYVDASAGGIDGETSNPWIYLSLKDGAKVMVTDPQSLTSTAWDVGVKRPLLRSNGGDVGVGQGGAVLIDKDFAAVTSSDVAAASIQAEAWFDDACNLDLDPTGAPITAFSAWYDYDQTTHVLTPHPGTFIVRGGDGTLYKLAILDYYATPDGGTGQGDGGFFKIEVAPL